MDGNSEFRIPNSEFALYIKILGLRQLPSLLEHRLHHLGQKLPHLLWSTSDKTGGVEEGLERTITRTSPDVDGFPFNLSWGEDQGHLLASTHLRGRPLLENLATLVANEAPILLLPGCHIQPVALRQYRQIGRPEKSVRIGDVDLPSVVFTFPDELRLALMRGVDDLRDFVAKELEAQVIPGGGF